MFTQLLVVEKPLILKKLMSFNLIGLKLPKMPKNTSILITSQLGKWPRKLKFRGSIGKVAHRLERGHKLGGDYP